MMDSRKRTAADGIFDALARAYMARENPHKKPRHHERFSNRMTKDVLQVLGQMQPRDIKPIDVIRAIAAIESRGVQNSAIRVVGIIEQVLPGTPMQRQSDACLIWEMGRLWNICHEMARPGVWRSLCGDARSN